MRSSFVDSLIEDVLISDILPPKYKFRGELADINDLILSISNQGLLEPIVIRPKDNKFELVSGSRRLAACRKIGLRKILCSIRELTDQEAFEVGLAENVARMSINPIEEARAFEAYTTQHGWGSESQLAKKIGKSPSYISKRRKLLSIPSEKLEEIFRRRKNMSLVDEILSFDDEEMRTILFESSLDSDISSKEVRRLRENIAKEKSNNEIWTYPTPSDEEIRSKRIKSAILKAVVALKIALRRLDTVLENIDDDEWVLREILMQQRLSLHNQIDLVANLTRRIEKIRPTS
jgi:ParB family transcriptional regulator, chromosome partitioning protein